jgi:hypothetical protein
MTRGMSGSERASEGILVVVDYHEAFPELAGVYLEDSWVLEIAAATDAVALRLETVLTPEHPLYRRPAPSEQHCYRTGWLELTGDEIDVRLSGMRPHLDPDGSHDHGNIDTFTTAAQGEWELHGGWGSVRITRPRLTLRLE